MKEQLWKRLADEVGGEIGEQLVESMKYLYDLYTPDVIDWFAGLFDAEVGGYYYSNSARDNEEVVHKDKVYKLRPDSESTNQALGFWFSTGMCKDISELPAWMVEKMSDYIYSLQDPDGFFYNYQWDKNVPLLRRGRDFSWCRSMLSRFGRTPKYPMITDLGTDKESSETLIPEHLSTPEKFAEYLDSKNIPERSYHGGSEVCSQCPQIIALGRMDQCIEYFNKLQNPETGHWHPRSTYYGVNGLLKISGIYNAAGVPIPHALEAANSAIDAITSDEPMSAVVDLYNTWFSIGNVLDNLRAHGGEEGIATADSIVKRLRAIAPAAIRKSREKIARFGKPGGCFSYRPDFSSFFSAGMPVCIDNSREGDVNATVISIMGIISHIYRALELTHVAVPLFGKEERDRYIALIEAKRKA